ncbi:MAG: alpha/beta fold hydrolase [Rubrivivax sp.]|nr:alpha/beta fold hydrolase [Rubrivivax sp.]
MSTAEIVHLRAADGYPLVALRYVPPRSADPALPAARPAGRILVAGATGVPQKFYRRFAQHAAQQGFEVLTLDYRGIGLSRPASLRGFRMNYLDWAQLDLAAAVDHLADGPTPLFMIGHSFGGHAFGLLPNHERVQRFYTFATGAGWHGWMPRLEQLKVRLMWSVVGPALVRWKGYLNWSLLGMGEDLPKAVFLQWRHWCRFPRYFFQDPAMPGLDERFAQVRTPIIAANALDDLWAPPRSRDAFMAAYRQAPVQTLDLSPRDLGVAGIGHMGYFRPSSQRLWDAALQWFAQHGSADAARLGAAAAPA